MPTHSQHFNGSSQWLSHADHADFDITGDITVEAWVKFLVLPSSSAEATMVSKYNDSTNQRQWRAAVYNNAGTYVGRFVTSSTGSNFDEGQVNFATAPVAGRWYHLAWAKTGTTYTFYVNGKAQGTDTVHSSQFSGSANLTIGAYDDGSTRSNYSNCLMKYVRIFDDLRTAAEIASDAASESVSNANLKAEWKLDGALTDSSGNSHTLTANGSPVYSVDIPWEGVAGAASTEYALRLIRASSQYAAIVDGSQTGLDISGDMTVEFWLNMKQLPSTVTDSYRVVCKTDGASGRAFVLLFNNNVTDGFECECYGDGTTNHRRVGTSAANIVTAADLGRWVHWAATFNVGTGAWLLYKNGVPLAVTTNNAGTVSSIYNSSAPVSIGAQYTGSAGSGYTDGLLKEVRIFSEIRTQAEIVADALAATVSDANLKAEWKLDNAYTDGSGNSNTLTASGSPTFQKWATDLTGSLLVSWWTLDETSGNRADSHASNTLTDTNTVGNTTGKKSNAADFVAGSSERLGGSLTGLPTSGNFTLACWYKGAAPSGDGVFGFGSGASTGVGRQFLVVSNKAYFGGYSADLDSGITITDGNWHHVVITYIGNVLSIYVDGALAAQTTVTLNTANSNFNIGARADSTSFITGSVDEGSVYARGFDYGDVLELYNEGNAITYVGSVSVTVGGTTQSLTASVPAYTVKRGSTVAVATQVVTSSLPARTVALPRLIAAAVQVLTLSIPTYIAGGNKIVAVATQALTLTVPAYTILKSWIQAVSTQAVTLSTVAVSIVQGVGVTVLAATQTITASIPTYTVVLVRNITVLVATQVLTLSTVTLAKVGAIWRKVSRNASGDWTRQGRNSN